MKNAVSIILLFLCIEFLSCHSPVQVPYEINRKMVVSVPCDYIGYSINRDTKFSPEIIVGGITGRGRLWTKPVQVIDDRSTYIQSMSCNCRLIASLIENEDGRGFDLGLQNLHSNRTYIFKDADVGSPAFSPENSLLAFLSDGMLKIFDYEKFRYLIVESPHVKIKSLSWSLHGKKIWLEDLDGNILSYDPKSVSYKQLTDFKHYFFGSRNITLDANDEESIYYLNDELDGVNNIYQLNSIKGSSLFYRSGFDKYLMSFPQKPNDFYFKSIENGQGVLKRILNSKVRTIISGGVVYDYLNLGRGNSIILHSNITTPISIRIEKNNRMIYRGPNKISSPIPKPFLYQNEEGMIHLLYKPKTETEHWVIFLHGGPWEQSQIRYNSYINSLVEHGIGVVAINYIGSTGIGNAYEKRSSNALLPNQITHLKDDIDKIKLRYKINPRSIIGISYGAILANRFVAKFPSDFDKVIDFSGLSTEYVSYPAERLFLYGSKDFMAIKTDRLKFISEASLHGKTTIKIFEDEGHYISRQQNIEQIVDELVNFLMK